MVDIKDLTDKWFSGGEREERNRFTTTEIQQRWKEMLSRFNDELTSGDVKGDQTDAEGPGDVLSE